MDIMVPCSHCNASFRPKDADTAKQGICPTCQAAIRDPELPASDGENRPEPSPQSAAAAEPDLSAVADAAPFQYSLRTLLILMTTLAVVCSLLIASPDWAKFLSGVFFVITLAAVLIVVMVYGRGYARTFCIGAIFPAGATMLFASVLSLNIRSFFHGTMGRRGLGPSEIGYTIAIYVGILLGVCLVLGLLACGVRWMVEGPPWHRQQQQQKEARRPAAIPDLYSKTDRAPFRGGALVPIVVSIALGVLIFNLLIGPDWARPVAMTCIVFALPVALTTMLVYARGYLRTFCIGALFPGGASLLLYQSSSILMETWFWYGDPMGFPIAFIISTAIIWVMSLATGGIVCGVRWSIEAPQRQQRQARQDRPAGDPWDPPPRG